MSNKNKIYTLSMNPAIDLFISMDTLEPYVVNRTNSESYRENGKAINISRVLHRMGIESTALGFIGGFSGDYIQKQLHHTGISTDFTEISGITRINVFLRAEHEYKIVNQGPSIPQDKIDELLEKLKDIPSNSFLFISGSLPLGIDITIYDTILLLAQKNHINIVLDISDPELLTLLKYNPYIIKPNRDELADFFEINHRLTFEEIIHHAHKIVQLGCPRVLVSLDKDGALYVDKDTTLYVTAPQGTVVNTTCAGDTLLGVFMGKLLQGESLEESLVFASASASSTAFTEDITDFQDIDQLITQINIRKV